MLGTDRSTLVKTHPGVLLEQRLLSASISKVLKLML